MNKKKIIRLYKKNDFVCLIKQKHHKRIDEKVDTKVPNLCTNLDATIPNYKVSTDTMCLSTPFSKSGY
jgi:hypothetical protein